jgi:hypothetical protein
MANTFHDPDLSTPEHDAIMMWLDKNAAQLFGLDRCETTWEATAKFGGGIRFIDLLAYGVSSDGVLEAYACEVKPVIKSIGELIRQLRQYEGHRFPTRSKGPRDERFLAADGHCYQGYGDPVTASVVVVSPDDRFKSIIENQGFRFIKAPQGLTVTPQPDLFG